MSVDSLLPELRKVTLMSDGAVLYMPIQDEIDYTEEDFPLVMPEIRCVISKSAHANPYEWADKCIAKFRTSKVCILVPGTKFDLYGTRHGRGAGWYDRFLSKLPPSWLRIGVINDTKLSTTKLARQTWDEPVNWILVRGAPGWTAHRAMDLA